MIFSIQSSIGQTISYGEYFIDTVGEFGTGNAIEINNVDTTESRGDTDTDTDLNK